MSDVRRTFPSVLLPRGHLTFSQPGAPCGVSPRVVQAELLDLLSPDHPAARHNRRDLRLTNAVMGNHRWLERALAAHHRPGDRLLELGAGGGECLARLARRGWPVDGLDLWPAPAALPGGAHWHRADLRTFDRYDRYEVVYGNLIFHQFTVGELHALGDRLQSARLIVACEPARRRASQCLFGIFAPLAGANHVSRHDAHVSIAAGFRGAELPHLFGLDPGRWAWRCSTTPLGAYRLVARRRGSGS